MLDHKDRLSRKDRRERLLKKDAALRRKYRLRKRELRCELGADPPPTKGNNRELSREIREQALVETVLRKGLNLD